MWERKGGGAGRRGGGGQEEKGVAGMPCPAACGRTRTSTCRILASFSSLNSSKLRSSGFGAAEPPSVLPPLLVSWWGGGVVLPPPLLGCCDLLAPGCTTRLLRPDTDAAAAMKAELACATSGHQRQHRLPSPTTLCMGELPGVCGGGEATHRALPSLPAPRSLSTRKAGLTRWSLRRSIDCDTAPW